MAIKVKITEELLHTHLAEWFDVRILNLFEKNDITTLEDLLYTCGRTYPCKKCKDVVGCELVKIVKMRGAGKGTLQIILNTLEEAGIIERVPVQKKKVKK